jgi:hypothetical protein
MARSHFEALANFLKAHPEARTLNTHRRGPENKRAPKRYGPPDPERHRRKCKICHHPNRDEIECDYLHWRTSRDIARSFGITDHTVIFRHAWATGLYYQRQRIIAYAVHPLLEQSEDIFIKATPSAIISAVETYSKINDEGGRIRSKPVTHVYHVNAPGARKAASNPEASGRERRQPPESSARRPNPNIQELEGDSTP